MGRRQDESVLVSRTDHRWFLAAFGVCSLWGFYMIWASLIIDHPPNRWRKIQSRLASPQDLRSIATTPRKASRLERYITDQEPGANCGDLSGFQRILDYREKWRSQARSFCEGGSSSLKCFVDDGGDSNVTRDYICTGRDVHVRMADLGNITKHDRLRIYGDCRATEEFRRLKFIDCENDVSKQMHDFRDVLGSTPSRCDRRIDTAVVMRIRERVGRNPWHTHEEIIALFMTMVAMEIDPAKVTLIINRPRPDPRQSYPLLAIHDGLFGVNETVFADELAGMNDTVCFGEIIVPIPPAQAFYAKRLREGCGKSSILRGYRAYLLDAYGVVTRSSRVMRITMISRTAQFKRRFMNEDEVTAALQQGDAREVRTVVLSEMNLTAQFETMANTDVLLGAHGAGLFWLVLLPECSQVLEVGTGADHHYRNLAQYSGINHRYLSQSVGHGTPDIHVDIEGLLKSVEEAEKQWRECHLM
ncbi:hypothetical protein FOZ62_028088 [Perkinsus olseni]|uniref:Glycosyltransferase 61 catalytic domain-containing protein n=1 Tax=Perkinsus olseni TaxID=32597 RepID=A0A7J6RV65_PEROL|nr:hypothetical protein FOZ62_028088 [Perkinsus olseni]